MTKRKQKEVLKIDWNSVLEDDGDGGGKAHQLPELVIVNAKTHRTQPSSESFVPGDQMNSLKSLPDQELEDQLERNKSHLLNFGPSLPDRGEKIRCKITSIEAEKQRRALHRSQMDTGRSSRLMHATNSGSDVFARGNLASKETSRQGNTDSKEVSRLTFASVFGKPKSDTQPTKAFCKELEDLGCASVKPKADKKIVKRQKSERRMLSEVGKTGHREKQSHGKRKRKKSSTYSLLDDDNDDDSNGHETPKDCCREAFPAECSRRRKKADDTVINVDEEEPQPSSVAKEAVELPERLPEEICYPSRDDRHFVQVCLKDVECLGPQEFLNSPVMNFYIRFLQQQVSSANHISADCHFFNTYFYKKLTDAVSYKGNDKDAFFVKFRRWWKGVDLFRKAYIFIPIHEDLHWSLIIVCIPDKEDESGLTILHLDSLRFHSKRSIVENVKRFLKDEWNYLNQDDDYLSNLPIAEKVWRNLARRITEPDIQVPQQKNEFDCGPFVLFFIERFIEEAPQRLKRKDLGMIDKKWFRPDEASALRVKIRNTLMNLFRVSDQTDGHNNKTNGHNDKTD